MNVSTLCKLLLALALAVMGLAGQACAQGYPNRPIKMLVPFAAGGGTDILARVLAAKMSEGLGQMIVVENRPGANSIIGSEALVRSAPDGYTLIMQTNNLASNVILNPGKLSFDTLKAFAPISLVAGNPHVLVVNPSVPAKDLREFIALAKSKSGGISYASGGTGTVSHFAGEYLKMLASIDMVHVPYQGSGQLMPNLLGGQVEALFAAVPTVTGHIRLGSLRAIAVTTTKRFHNLPSVPTIAESGFPSYDLSSWFGVLAPAGTPRPVIDRLQAEIVKALKDPSLRESLTDFEIFGSTPEEFAAFIKTEIDNTAKIVRASGTKIEN